MINFLETPAAKEWVKDALVRHSNKIFGSLAPAVIWTDSRDNHGKLIVETDPMFLVNSINSLPYMIFEGHDHGKPKGQVIEAKKFVSEQGSIFVAAIFGYYEGGNTLSFQTLGFDRDLISKPPAQLPDIPKSSLLEISTDSREVDSHWLTEISKGSPLQIEFRELSLNSAESINELITIAMAWGAIAWNPFVTSVATEAGKDTYHSLKKWFKNLLLKTASLNAPVVQLCTIIDDCQVSFLFRSKDVKLNYTAHESLSSAATQARNLVDNFCGQGLTARSIIYEFDKIALKWFPSYAILADGRIVTDNSTLISLEQIPKQLSLGLKSGTSYRSIINSESKSDDS